MKKFNTVSVFTALVTLCALALTGPVTALAAGPSAINLGTAGTFVILAKTGISTTGSTAITGDIGVSPVAATYMTGFALILPVASAFSTSALVTGKVYAPGYADPTPANISTAVSDMQTAYTDGAGRTNPTATELGAGNIGGLTISPGLYKWGTGVIIPTDVTLSGSANDVWIFQVAQNLDVSSAAKVVLGGGAQASNVFWIVAGQTTIGTTAVFNGNVLDQTAVVLKTGAQLNGRMLAQTAVTLDSNTVTIPTLVTSTSVPTPTQTQTSIPVTTSTTGTAQTGTGAGVQTTTSGTTGAADQKVALQAQLNGLLATLQTLQSRQGTATPNVNAVTNANMNASFKRNLVLGTTGDDVKALQVWLNVHGYAVALSGFGSLGNETNTFGPLTRKALAKFQAKVGITPALGNFGPLTREYLSAHYN